ncbi:MAG: LysR family transcriptional regulator [Lachnospiraceae bacterium]|nr:LysR family transcriptional regulator [Lachnospiraceae bacterium]
MEQNLNHYKIFYEVARCGNISKAAENLYISQPAVSKSISKLEQSLSHTLFIRSKRGVKLTEEGKTLYEHLDKAFDTIDHAEKKLKQISELGMGQLRIGASTSLCKHILLPYLQDYIELNPHVKVSIDCKPTFETLRQLKDDKIDIGLICETDLDNSYDFMPVRAIHDTFVTTRTYLNNLILRERHTSEYSQTANTIFESNNNSISDKNNTGSNNNIYSFKHTLNEIENTTTDHSDNISILPNMTGLFMFTEHADPQDYTKLSEKEILEKCNLMLLDKGNISRIYIDDYMNANNIHPSQILEINNMDLLIDFAAIGMGVAGVVREFISDYIETEQVIEIPMDYDISPRTVGFVYNKNTLSNQIRKFIDFINTEIF